MDTRKFAVLTGFAWTGFVWAGAMLDGSIIRAQDSPRPRAEQAAPRVPTETRVTLYGPPRLTPLSAGWEAYRDAEAERQAQVAYQRRLIDDIAWWSGWPAPGNGPFVAGYGGVPGWQPLFATWWSPGQFFGYRVPRRIRQPDGHRLTFYGPNAYSYEPVYADEARGEADTPFFPAPQPRKANGAPGQAVPQQDEGMELPPAPLPFAPMPPAPQPPPRPKEDLRRF